MRVIVIGGGILGASTAFHLSTLGAETILVDSAEAGRATAAGAGIICPWVSEVEDPGWYRLAAAGAAHYPDLIAGLAEAGQNNLGYQRVGALAVSDEASLDRLEQRLHRRRGDHAEVGDITRVSAGEARGLFPALRHGVAGVHVAGAARLDGRLVAAALAEAAVRAGARRRGGTAEVLMEGTRLRGVRLHGAAIHGDRLVLAAGVWANRFLAPLGIRLPIEPQRGQIVHLMLPGTRTDEWPVLLPLTGHYLLTFAPSRVVIGATRENGTGLDGRVTAAGQAEVLREGLAVAPGLAEATLVETRVGFRPMGPDPAPLLGLWPGLEGLAIGNGLAHTGLTTGAYAGRLLARLVLGLDVEIDLSPYDPARGPVTAHA